jgi:hypothetical protein
MTQIDRVALRAGKNITQINEFGEKEEWRLISNDCPKFVLSSYENSVQYASSLGRLMRFSGEILNKDNFFTDKNGYQHVGLGGKRQSVHCIICSTFHGPPPQQSNGKRYYEIDHKNGHKDDNTVSNLHWATIKEQMDNRGKKQVSRLEDGESRELMKPAKLQKPYKVVPDYGQSKSAKVYVDYVTNEMVTIELLSEKYTISRSTTVGYLISCFNPQQDTDIFLKKLCINTSIVTYAYEVMRATQIARVSDGVSSKEYTTIIYEALGENCKEPDLATHLLSRIYNHISA